ncbi:MAG: AlpA family phage regulatory protein [Candidatus Eisenbacteria sp.]|nr:AlpA family phage regulatory protein [Candidatus Eisenbacteria bacterium]
MQNQGPSGAILRRKETCRFVGLSDSTIRRLEIRGKFPRRVKLTERLIGWRRCDLEAWVQARRAPAQRRQKHAHPAR